jgi:phosphotriesterase-related protein
MERGFIDQLMVGTDGARRSLWVAYGGAPGLAWLASDFRGVLETVGIGRDLQNEILVTNPARFLAMADHVGIETET